MSRHRNVRSMRYSDEYDGYDDVYGHSVEEDYAMSPSDAAFLYDRSTQPQVSSFLSGATSIAEECEKQDEDEDEASVQAGTNLPQINESDLNETERAQLLSCLDDIRNVLGDDLPESKLVDAILAVKFDSEKALDKLLTAEEVKMPVERQIESPKLPRVTAPKNEKGGQGEKVSVATRCNPAPTRFDVVAFLNDAPLAPIELVPAVPSSVTVAAVSTVVKPVSEDALRPSNRAIGGRVNDRRIRNQKLATKSIRASKLSKLGHYICLKAVKICTEKLSFEKSLKMDDGKTKKEVKRFLFDSPSPDDSNSSKRRVNVH